MSKKDPKRFECQLKEDAAEVLEKQGGSKSEFVNRAIVAFWHATEGDKLPLVSRDTMSLQAKLIAKELAKKIDTGSDLKEQFEKLSAILKSYQERLSELEAASSKCKCTCHDTGSGTICLCPCEPECQKA